MSYFILLMVCVNPNGNTQQVINITTKLYKEALVCEKSKLDTLAALRYKCKTLGGECQKKTLE